VVLLGDEAELKLVSVHLEIVLNLKEDRCTVCAERTIGSENILNTLDGTPRLGHLEYRLETMLVSLQDRCLVCTKHTVGLEIVMDIPDGTPRFTRLKRK
jgi:hypothetical protein